MAGKSPRKGWIYMINPYKVSLRCRSGHQHIYNLDELREVECKTNLCLELINSSRVFRGNHPHIIWTNDKFKDDVGYIQTFTVIPLTSQTTSLGLPTTYPITNTARNGLDKKSYALVHQICTVDGNCFKDASGDWKNRCGQLDANDKSQIEDRLKYFLGFDNTPDDDWFKNNTSPELIQIIFNYLPDDKKKETIEILLDNLD